MGDMVGQNREIKRQLVPVWLKNITVGEVGQVTLEGKEAVARQKNTSWTGTLSVHTAEEFGVALEKPEMLSSSVENLVSQQRDSSGKGESSTAFFLWRTNAYWQQVFKCSDDHSSHVGPQSMSASQRGSLVWLVRALFAKVCRSRLPRSVLVYFSNQRMTSL